MEHMTTEVMSGVPKTLYGGQVELGSRCQDHF